MAGDNSPNSPTSTSERV